MGAFEFGLKDAANRAVGRTDSDIPEEWSLVTHSHFSTGTAAATLTLHVVLVLVLVLVLVPVLDSTGASSTVLCY